MDCKKKIEEFLKTKYINESDYKIIKNKIYSKTSISFQTLNCINEIISVIAVFYLTENSIPFKLGYKIGVCLDLK